MCLLMYVMYVRLTHRIKITYLLTYLLTYLSDRQASRSAAFLQAEDRPMSNSIANNYVCLGRPTGHLQSGGGFRIADEFVHGVFYK